MGEREKRVHYFANTTSPCSHSLFSSHDITAFIFLTEYYSFYRVVYQVFVLIYGFRPLNSPSIRVIDPG